MIFLYSRHFTLQTDQKTLVSIFRKHFVISQQEFRELPSTVGSTTSKPNGFQEEKLAGLNFHIQLLHL